MSKKYQQKPDHKSPEEKDGDAVDQTLKKLGEELNSLSSKEKKKLQKKSK